MASLLADKKKISKKLIGDILGHLNLSRTEIYLHSLSEGAAVASDALEREFDFGVGFGVGFEPKRPLLPTPGGINNDENQ